MALRAGVGDANNATSAHRPNQRVFLTFWISAALPIVLSFVPPITDSTSHLVVSAGVFVVVVLVGQLCLGRREPGWWVLATPVLLLVELAVLRDGTSVPNPLGTGLLVLLPILWVGLYGRRVHLYLVSSLIALTFLLPMLIVGGPKYPLDDWHRVAVYTVFALLIGPLLQNVVSDLREREAAQLRGRQQVEAAASRWRVLLDHLPDILVMVYDEELVYSEAFGAGYRRLGLDNVVGRHVYEVSAPETAAIVRPVAEAALNGQEGTVEVPSSTRGWLQRVTAVPLPSADGRRRGMILARDISAEQRREAELRRLEVRARRLFDEAPHGALLTGPTGIITQVNPALCQMLGQTQDELVGTTLEHLAPPDDRETWRQLAPEVFAGGSARWERELTLAHRDGRRLHVVATAVLLDRRDDDRASALITVLDLSERRRAELELAYLADHDPLTGLANRRRFDAEVDKHLARNRRNGPRGALMMLDLDDFKVVNDTLGHTAGDVLIVRVADMLAGRLRETDLLARLGGDEFAVLLPDADEAGARRVALDLVSAVHDDVAVEDWPDPDHPYTPSTSVGVVMINDPGVGGSELLSTADLCMYEAKESGRNRYALRSVRDSRVFRPDTPWARED